MWPLSRAAIRRDGTARASINGASGAAILGVVPRARGPPRYRGTKRILLLDPQRRAGNPSGLQRARHRLRPVQPLGRVFFTGTVNRSTEFSEGDIWRPIPRFTAENRAANQALMDHVMLLARRRAPRRDRSRWRGCWPSTGGSCRSPAPGDCGWRKTPARPTRRCPRRGRGPRCGGGADRRAG